MKWVWKRNGNEKRWFPFPISDAFGSIQRLSVKWRLICRFSSRSKCLLGPTTDQKKITIKKNQQTKKRSDETLKWSDQRPWFHRRVSAIHPRLLCDVEPKRCFGRDSSDAAVDVRRVWIPVWTRPRCFYLKKKKKKRTTKNCDVMIQSSPLLPVFQHL